MSSRTKTKKRSLTPARRKQISVDPNVSTKRDADADRDREEPKRERSKSRKDSEHRGRRSSMTATDEPKISTKADGGGDETKRERSQSKTASQHRGRRNSISAVDEPNISTKIDGDGPIRERSKSRKTSEHRGRRSSMTAADEPNISTKTDGDEAKRECSKTRRGVQRTKSSDQPNVSTEIDRYRDEPKRERSQSIRASQRGRRSSITAVDELNISTKTSEDEPKREASKSKKGSSTTVRRKNSSDEPNVSTKIDGDKDSDDPQRKRSSSIRASQHRGRRSSMSAADDPAPKAYPVRRKKSSEESNVSTKTDGDGEKDREEPKREEEVISVAMTPYRSKTERLEEVIPMATPYRSKTEKRPEQIIPTATPYRSKTEKRQKQVNSTAVTPYRSKTEKRPDEVIRASNPYRSTMKDRSSTETPEEKSKRKSEKKDNKESKEEKKEHRSGSHRASRSSKQGTNSSRSRSRRPSDSRDKQIGSSSGVSPTKRGSQSPRSPRPPQTHRSSRSRSHAPRSKSLTPRTEGQRKKSQDSIKLLLASVDIGLTDAHWPKRERRPSVSAVGTSSTMAIQSSVWTNPARPKFSESEAPEMLERKMSRRMSNPAALTNSDQQPVTRPYRRSHSMQTGGHVQRMSLQASGQNEGDKLEITMLEAESTACEVIPFVDGFNAKEKSVHAYSPEKILAYNPKKLASSSDAIATALTNSDRQPVTRPHRRSHSMQPGGRVRRMSLHTSGQGEGGKLEIIMLEDDITAREVIPFVDSFDQKEKSVLAYCPKKLASSSETIATALTNSGPRPKIIKNDDENAFGVPSPNRAPRTTKYLNNSLNKVQPSRRASLTAVTGQVDDDANSVASSISRLQRFMSLSSNAKDQEPANVMAW
jgi:hypothetical protein